MALRLFVLKPQKTLRAGGGRASQREENRSYRYDTRKDWFWYSKNGWQVSISGMPKKRVLDETLSMTGRGSGKTTLSFAPYATLADDGEDISKEQQR
jgi:hypothetical protein